jgi:CheY-specific phosphatase CheX
MTQDRESALCQTAIQIFEELGFMLPTMELDELQRSAQADASVSVDFKGGCSGRLIISITGDLLPDLAANMLGESEMVSEQEQRDALGEMANVICGNLLPKLFGTDAVFQLASPVFSAAPTRPDQTNGNPAAVARIGLEQGQAQLTLFID